MPAITRTAYVAFTAIPSHPFSVLLHVDGAPPLVGMKKFYFNAADALAFARKYADRVECSDDAKHYMKVWEEIEP